MIRAIPLALLAVPSLLGAQPDTATRRPARLFRATDPVVISLTADFKTVFKDRDSMSTKQYPAVMRWLGEKGDTTAVDVKLETRGHYRLRTCSVTPLKVDFDKEKTKGTLFGGEGGLKLSTHCQKADRYTQNVYLEYAAYGMYNVLTPVSLRARLATITWHDPKDPGFTVTRPGFWIEDDDGMADRNRGKILMAKGGTASQMDSRQMAITDLFQYMIGNTDFSISALHNIRILQTDTSATFYPMAYDFDWSGLVDAPYAAPDYRLPIKRVTDRLYRGGCHLPEVMTETIALFNRKKGEIYGVLAGIAGLQPSRRKEATDFLDAFYKIINDPGSVRREIMRVCP
ncbi:MAG: hypothetical protein HOP28_18565 [Gemmatimonadales bacterium]|nr:hypothetical protein [Gemmatimonadales bacterium]